MAEAAFKKVPLCISLYHWFRGHDLSILRQFTVIKKNANAYLTLCLQPPTESDASTCLKLDKNKAFSELHASLLCKKKKKDKGNEKLPSKHFL